MAMVWRNSSWPCIVYLFTLLHLACVCVCVFIFSHSFYYHSYTVNVEHLIYSYNLAYIAYIVMSKYIICILYMYRMLNLYEIRPSLVKWTMNFWIFQIETRESKTLSQYRVYTRNIVNICTIKNMWEKQKQKTTALWYYINTCTFTHFVLYIAFIHWLKHLKTLSFPETNHLESNISLFISNNTKEIDKYCMNDVHCYTTV